MVSGQKTPILLRTESQSEQKPIWERMDGEKAADYMHFRTYLLMGRGRTLQAVAEQERRPRKAQKGTDRESVQSEETSTETVKKVSIPGSLKRASVRFRWRERAAEWDEHERTERHKRLLAFLDYEAEYITRAQRLGVLDAVMAGLIKVTTENPVTGESYRNYMMMHRQILATIREIRREMAEFDKSGARSFSEVDGQML